MNPPNPPAPLEIAALQHAARTGARGQQDAMLLVSPTHSECWQAPARRKRLALDAGPALLAVADGVSCSPQAALASRSLLQTLKAQAMNAAPGLPLPHLLHRTRRAWQTQCLRRDTHGASTTLAALHVHGARACVVNVGDSRVWRLRQVGGALECLQLSHDHTLWQAMLDAGEVSGKHEPASFQQGLTQCLSLGDDAQHDVFDDSGLLDGPEGNGPEPGADMAPAPPEWHIWQGDAQPGDVFLLATDGMHGGIPHFDARRFWEHGQPMLHNLLKLYAAWHASGGADDLSLMALHICPDESKLPTNQDEMNIQTAHHKKGK